MKEIPKINQDDYFKYIKTFKIWLKIKKNKKLEDLEKKKVQKCFKKFIKRWNKNKLKDIFYNEEELIQKYGNEITHQWKFQNEEKVENQISIQDKQNKQIFHEIKDEQNTQKTKQGPSLPNFEEKQKISLTKYEEQKNLMLMHDVEANNTYKWENFNMKREDRRMLQKAQQQNEINLKILAHKQKEDEKLKSILDTVNLGNKFQKG